MPPRVHLIAISQEPDEDNRLGLKMSVAGDSRDRVEELVRRMEDSNRFAQPKVTGEHLLQTITGDNEQFDMEAFYVPEPLLAASASAKTDVKSKTEASPKTAAPTKPKGSKP
jgi:hypothetical protein